MVMEAQISAIEKPFEARPSRVFSVSDFMGGKESIAQAELGIKLLDLWIPENGVSRAGGA